MPGLQLGISAGGRVRAGTGGPPASADPGATITSLAYGQGATAAGSDRTAAYGMIGAGVIALAVLVFLWVSLPR